MTPNLLLPYLQQNQAQKHVTLNESLKRLDALVQLAVETIQPEPPSAPAEGARYIVGPAPQGTWTGHAGEVAAWYDGAWDFLVPEAGWQAWIRDDQQMRVWSGADWTAQGALDQPALLGINATPDTTNRLAVSAPAALFTHEGDGHRLTVNKADTPDTASLVFQTGYSARAEIGLTGDDAFSVKVSADGSAWTTGLTVKSETGETLATGLHSGEVMIADDAAVLVVPPAAGGMMAIALFSETFPQVSYSGIVCFDTGTTPGLLALANGGKLGLYPDQALSGTTGADVQLNVGAVTDSLWIENRFGSAQTFRYFFFC
ncbi:DUF2793 domain-containing protein [Henriciella aquimarina]|uniref:DUF2793 domain-containing protein n=1 Tax=Henriciella aquimarina TaxID=545261 RepID=UPI0009FDF4A9|nr:DUF2793 domain-containing protein [Henriciella aquimarina]